jgi:signal transduction histidine kinase
VEEALQHHERELAEKNAVLERLTSAVSHDPKNPLNTISTLIFVRDNGLGIDPRHQQQIFDPVEKLDPATQGTGLGLALVKRIVAAHAGRIWVEPEGNSRGTTFRFTLAA